MRLLTGDCRDVLATLPGASVQCVVTSPPYFGLRDYGTASWQGGDAACNHKAAARQGVSGQRADRQSHTLDGNVDFFRDVCGKCGATRVDQQIGLETSVEEYVATLVAVFREVRRVLRDDGVVFLNLGDSYSSQGGSKEAGKYHHNTGQGQNRQSAGQPSRNGIEGLKPKDLIGVPWLVAKALQAPYYVGRIKNESDRAYLAGFIDGEGTISFVERDRGPDHTPTHDVRVFVTNTNRAILERYQQMTTGHIYERKDKAEGRFGDLPCYRWQMGTHDAAMLLREIYPYLQLKRKQAALMWTLYTTLRHKNGHARTPDEVVKKRRALSDMVRALNRGEHVDVPSWVEHPPSPTEPGWYLRSDIIWAKSNPMPESVRDRPTKAHEYIFLLTKGPRYFWDAEAVKEEAESRPLSSWDERREHEPIRRGDPGQSGHVTRTATLASSTGRNIRSVWTIATAPFAEAHFATFPPELAARCIKAGTSEKGCCSVCGAPWVRVVREGEKVQTGNGRGPNAAVNPNRHTGEEGALAFYVREKQTTGWRPTCAHHLDSIVPVRPCVVLDPFSGAGTTALVADRLGRDAIGIDLSPEYTRMAERRIRADGPLFAAVETS